MSEPWGMTALRAKCVAQSGRKNVDRGSGFKLWICHFELCDFGHALFLFEPQFLYL